MVFIFARCPLIMLSFFVRLLLGFGTGYILGLVFWWRSMHADPINHFLSHNYVGP